MEKKLLLHSQRLTLVCVFRLLAGCLLSFLRSDPAWGSQLPALATRTPRRRARGLVESLEESRERLT